MMLRLLIDTCVWLDMAKDYRHQPTLSALEQMMEAGEVSLVLPKQAVKEFESNKARIIKDSGKSLSSTFKRVKEAVNQFGREDGKAETLASLDDVDHRVAILGEAVNESIQRIEKIFAQADLVETSDTAMIRAARRAVEGRAPFHKNKNSIGDAILIEIYREVVGSGDDDDTTFAFVTHNKHDFSHMANDEREPHPDIAELFPNDRSTYALALGEVLSNYLPEWMEEVRWEFEYQEEPRLLGEIIEAEGLLFRVWYNRHWNLRVSIERGKHKLVTTEEWEKAPPKRRQKMTVDTVWVRALAAARKTEDEIGMENLGPWSDFEWGMLNGKLSALRWVTGSEWDFLDT